MVSEELAQFVQAEFSRLADAGFAERTRQFFKEEITAWGVRAQQLREIERVVSRELRGWTWEARTDFYERLWTYGRLEDGFVVCHSARRFVARGAGDREWLLFQRWLDQYITNWALCDGLANWLLSSCLKKQPFLKSELPKWAKSRNRWRRRAAMVCLLADAKKARSFDEICGMALLLQNDPEPLVQKAIGWVLKEAYVVRPEETFEFVRLWRGLRSVVTIAGEKMTPEHRGELGLKAAATRVRRGRLCGRGRRRAECERAG